MIEGDLGRRGCVVHGRWQHRPLLLRLPQLVARLIDRLELICVSLVHLLELFGRG